MLIEVTAQTVADSAIGDYDTIGAPSEIILRSPVRRRHLHRHQRQPAPQREPHPARPAPAWLEARVAEHLYEVNRVISAGGH